MWVYIDKSLMCQWSCSDRCGCFQVACESVEEFDTFPTRSLALFALGLWTLLLPALCIWLALGPGVHAPVYGGFWTNFSFIFVVTARDTTSAFSRWLHFFCAMLGSTVDACSSTDSRPAHQGDFHVLQHGEVCTVDASVAWTARVYGT